MRSPQRLKAPPLEALPTAIRTPRALQTIRYGLDPEGFFSSARERYGDVFTIRILGETWVVLADPLAVKEVFSHGPDEMNSGEANLALRALIGTENVLLLDGPQHLHRRRLLLPPFHGERMRAYEQLIRVAARQQVADWPLDRPAAALPRMQELTFAVIMESVFGVEQDDEVRELGEAMRDILSWVGGMRRGLTLAALGPDRLMRLPSFRRGEERIDRAVFAQIAKQRSNSDLERRQDILSMLLQARDEQGRGLSDRELRDELITLLVAGHETTATLLAWSLHYLARDPASQDRVAAEAGADSQPYTEAVIAETLRLRPPVPVVLRRLRRPLRIAGCSLPAGATVAPCTLLVHRRDDLYADPWSFSPHRFLDRRPAAGEWFPFGGSVRRCLGAAFAQFEARIVLGEILLSLRFSAPRPEDEGVGRRGPVLVPRAGARLIAETRRVPGSKSAGGEHAEPAL